MPSKMEAPESAKTITVYVNGEQENGEITWNKNIVLRSIQKAISHKIKIHTKILHLQLPSYSHRVYLWKIWD